MARIKHRSNCEIEITGKCTCDYEKRVKRARARRDRDAVLRSLGLKKVRGALGGVYWE